MKLSLSQVVVLKLFRVLLSIAGYFRVPVIVIFALESRLGVQSNIVDRDKELNLVRESVHCLKRVSDKVGA